MVGRPGSHSARVPRLLQSNTRLQSPPLVVSHLDHQALYNRRNFLHYLIPPPFQVLFVTLKKIFCLLMLNRLFLNNVNVESFVKCRKMFYVIKCIKMGGGDNVLKACPRMQWSLPRLSSTALPSSGKNERVEKFL